MTPTPPRLDIGSGWRPLPTAILLSVALLLPAITGCRGGAATHRVDWSAHFGGREGAFVLLNVATNERLRHNPALCETRYAPCSTFKIVNALIALETGVATDGDMLIRWDGVQRTRAALNRDHTLRSAMADSAVWYFQELARRIGSERMQFHLDRIDYGNRDISGGPTRFWLDGSLAISADEQVDLLARMQRAKLAFSERSVAIVREAIIVEQTDAFILRGKSGSCDGPGDDDHGWFIGTVERDDQTWAFACLIVGPRAWGYSEARAIAESILAERGLIGRQIDAPRAVRVGSRE